ncbi:GQ67_01393T0 [Komagataella phaffii]|nr:GQ67_01393T0 [Komagataella phaffii]AOA65902.1 GQ68_01409T0 [Komagataella phaffii GS115]
MGISSVHEYAEVYSLEIAYGTEYQLQMVRDFCSWNGPTKKFFGIQRTDIKQLCDLSLLNILTTHMCQLHASPFQMPKYADSVVLLLTNQKILDSNIGVHRQISNVTLSAVFFLHEYYACVYAYLHLTWNISTYRAELLTTKTYKILA